MAVQVEKTCVVCGGIYYVDGLHTYSKMCSKACADLIHTRKRRALLSTSTVEDVNPVDIYEHDDWICQICGKPVKQGVNGKHPLQPSLDHIIPLSKGGTHTPDNLRCTHLKCNIERGNRGAAQTRMTISVG